VLECTECDNSGVDRQTDGRTDRRQLTKTAIEKKEKAIAASLALLCCRAAGRSVFFHESTRKQKQTNHRNVHSPTKPTSQSYKYEMAHGESNGHVTIMTSCDPEGSRL